MDTKFCGRPIISDRNGRTIFEKTPGQQKLVDTINSNDIIFVSGPSGTGKTAIATWVGIAGIDDGKYERLILTRPVVTGGEELGFLPGSLDEKVAPYMQPLKDAIAMIKGYPKQHDAEKEVVKREPLSAKEKKRMRASAKDVPAPVDFYDRVRVCPLAYIRGSTLAKSYIVCDEFQNVTPMQMKMMITRLGRGSKMIICGDPNQCDLPEKATSGFNDAIRLLDGVRGIGFVELGVDDIVRHPMMKEIILRYERPGYRANSGNFSDEDDFRKIPAHTWERDREGYDFSDERDELEDGICTHCDGTGVDSFTGDACPICGGTGHVE